MKKGLSFVLTFLLLAALCLPVLAAPGGVAQLKLEQYYADMPDIDVWFYPVDADGVGVTEFSASPSDIEANLDGRSLSVISAQPASEEPTVYVLLIDISKSIGPEFFENIKATILDWVPTLGEQDKLIFIPMGDTIWTLLEGNEDRASAIAAIEGLEQQDKSRPTKYYEALNKAIDKAERLTDGTRCVMITVTDGLNSSSGMYTPQGTLERMQKAKLPMFTIGVGRDDNQEARQELASFTEKTNGTYFDLSKNDRKDPEKVSALFGDLTDTLRSCWHIGLKAPSNSVTGGILRLKVNKEGGAVNLTIKDFRIDSWQSDTRAPYVDSIVIKTPFSIKVHFSEPVIGADKISNYVIYDQNEVPLVLDSATYDSADNTATVKLKDELYDGTYFVNLINITDDSIEKNPIALDPAALPNLTQTGNPRPEEPAPEPESNNDWFLAFGWIILLGLLMLGLLIVILVLVAVRKKKEAREAEEAAGTEYNGTPGSAIGGAKVNLAAVDGRNVELTVVERNGVSRSVTMFIADSCIIGRSAASCDLAIEDQRMSRQHCALCYSGGDILINDLGSSNGTTVNGIPVNGYRKLYVNDCIEAGNTKLIVKAC